MSMELKTLTEQALALFDVDNPEHLGEAVFKACNDTHKLDEFCTLVRDDLSVDYLQMIYQYYCADRKDSKQDFTPKTIASFMGLLVGKSDHIIDMCAGSGALIIQKWCQNKELRFTAIEYDKNVIPYLIFNMVLRNINCRIVNADALTDDEPFGEWDITKGEKYGNLVIIKPAI